MRPLFKHVPSFVAPLLVTLIVSTLPGALAAQEPQAKDSNAQTLSSNVAHERANELLSRLLQPGNRDEAIRWTDDGRMDRLQFSARYNFGYTPPH